MKKTLLTIAITMAALFATCGMAFASNAVVDSGGYTHPSKFSNCMVIDGIDVSYYQQTIDWGKVKRQGIDYAIIRIGYTNLDSPFRTNLDSFFEQNYENARANGVMVGVYYYSCATSLTEAQKEAQFVLDTLNGRELDMPVAFDCEYAGRLKTAYDNAGTTTEKRTKLTSISLAFLNYITKNSDYEAMFYSYRNMMCPVLYASSYKLNMSLIDNKYKVWLAQYSSDNSYARPFEFWQYTSSGKVTGITGSVDCNFWYFDSSADATVSGTTNINSASVSLSRTSYEYTKFKKQPIITATYNGTTLKKGTDYDYYYIKNVLAGTGYAMLRGKGKYSGTKLVPFTITTTDIAEGGTVADIADYTYDGTAKKPTVKVQYTGTTLTKGTDYTVSYSNNTNAGTATVKITGKRNFHGTLTKTFKINKATPTFSGYSSYTRTVSRADWTLNTKSTSDAVLTYKSSDTSIATVDSSGKVSLKGGTGVVYITVTSPATSNYAAATKQVKITVSADEAAAATITTGADSYSKTVSDTGFDLGASANSGGALTFSSSDTTIASVSSDGYVTLKGKAGTATITIQCAAAGNYEAATKTVKITVTEQSSGSSIVTGVENTTIKASSVLGSGFIRLNWTKSAGYKVDYFEIYRSTSKTGFGDTPFFTTSSGTATTYKNTKSLEKGVRYYYRIRGVRSVNGQTVYTQWSNLSYRLYNPTAVSASSDDLQAAQAVQSLQLVARSANGTAPSGKKAVQVYWYAKNGSTLDLDGYEIYRSTKVDNNYGSTPIFTTKNEQYYNTSAKSGVKYYYKVRGYKVINGEKVYTPYSLKAIRTAK